MTVCVFIMLASSDSVDSNVFKPQNWGTRRGSKFNIEIDKLKASVQLKTGVYFTVDLAHR